MSLNMELQTCAICGDKFMCVRKHIEEDTSCGKAIVSYRGYNILCNSCGQEIPRNISDIINHASICDPELTEDEVEEIEDERSIRKRAREEKILLECKREKCSNKKSKKSDVKKLVKKPSLPPPVMLCDNEVSFFAREYIPGGSLPLKKRHLVGILNRNIVAFDKN